MPKMHFFFGEKM